jgi:hypothetical protein
VQGWTYGFLSGIDSAQNSVTILLFSGLFMPWREFKGRRKIV